jgi:hypothetical protein
MFRVVTPDRIDRFSIVIQPVSVAAIPVPGYPQISSRTTLDETLNSVT